MAITQTIDIPANRRLIIQVPSEVPLGRMIITYTPVVKTQESDYVGECPECAKHRNPETGELRFNAETIAAFKEGDAMLAGEIPAKWYNSLDEMLEDLDK